MKNKTLKRLLHLFMALSFVFTLWGKKHYSEETITRYMEEVDTLFAAIRHFSGDPAVIARQICWETKFVVFWSINIKSHKPDRTPPQFLEQ